MVTNQPVSLECCEVNRIEPRPVHNAFQQIKALDMVVSCLPLFILFTSTTFFKRYILSVQTQVYITYSRWHYLADDLSLIAVTICQTSNIGTHSSGNSRSTHPINRACRNSLHKELNQIHVTYPGILVQRWYNATVLQPSRDNHK